ncbi:MAG: 50S ribosomal protein L32 [Pseudomonadota bacterium]
MAVPKSKITRSRRNMRRSHDAIFAQAYHECSNCGEAKLPHNICPHCGYYDNREIVSPGL